ncbi:hypothetical protein LSAT2_002116 [Lamellibrachia satsuma]|nr:hypothetical protein LSAT2_002116 [Lamellibrachia satsuma]
MAMATPAVIGQLNDVDYINWLKAAKAAHCTVEGLRSFCRSEMIAFHNSVVTLLGSTQCSVPCTNADLVYGKGNLSIVCNSGVCSKWLAKIVANLPYVGFKLTVNNSNINKWPIEPWQVAKLFMAQGQDPASVSSNDTDISGILQLLTNCKHFSAAVRKKAEAVKKVRNEIMHSSTMKVTATDLSSYIRLMVRLLEDQAQLLSDPDAHQAVLDIQQIETTTLDVRDAAFHNLELQAWKQMNFDTRQRGGWNEKRKADIEM